MTINVSTKILKCDSMTQDKACHVVSNDEVVKGLSTLNIERMRCIRESKEALIKATRGFKRMLDHSLNEARHWHVGCSLEATKIKQTECHRMMCSFE